MRTSEDRSIINKTHSSYYSCSSLHHQSGEITSLNQKNNEQSDIGKVASDAYGSCQLGFLLLARHSSSKFGSALASFVGSACMTLLRHRWRTRSRSRWPRTSLSPISYPANGTTVGACRHADRICYCANNPVSPKRPSVIMPRSKR